mgnify:CR=1 FL=1
MQIIQNRAEEDHLRNNNDKDMMLKKYSEQADEILRLRSNLNCLVEQKTRLEEELGNLYLLEIT